MEAIKILTQPLSNEEIEWKIISSKNGQTTLAPYIDARAVMSRLDRAFGPFGWQVRYAPAQVGNEHGVIASIAIKHPETGEWVEKQDGSGASDMEPFKGGISGALKRAATAWGIGRELYSYPRVVVEGEHKYIPFKVLDRIKELPEAVAKGEPLPETIRLNAEGESVKKAISSYRPQGDRGYAGRNTGHAATPQGVPGHKHRGQKIMKIALQPPATSRKAQ